MVVRGGGSVAPGLSEGRKSAGDIVAASPVGSELATYESDNGMTAPGQTIAQSGAQLGVQHPIESCSAIPAGEADIEQSDTSAAKAGPDVAARDKASQMSKNNLVTDGGLWRGVVSIK